MIGTPKTLSGFAIVGAQEFADLRFADKQIKFAFPPLKNIFNYQNKMNKTIADRGRILTLLQYHKILILKMIDFIIIQRA